MKIFELAQKLKAIYDLHGDIEVHFSGPNQDQEPYGVEKTVVRVAENEEFPDYYNMPEGYKFVLLKN